MAVNDQYLNIMIQVFQAGKDYLQGVIVDNMGFSSRNFRCIFPWWVKSKRFYFSNTTFIFFTPLVAFPH